MTTFEARDFAIHSGAVKSGAWLLEAAEATARALEAARRVRFPQIPSKGLDALGITQRKLNGNFNSWMDSLSDQEKEEGNLWYPTSNEFAQHKAQEYDRHPDKVYGAMSKLSPQRKWYDNLDDLDNIAANHGHNPGGILRPAGISGGDNLKQALRVFDAPDDPAAIEAAFLGGKKISQIPKTYDFKTNIADPERGGAYNYAAHPVTNDTWMGRALLWSKNAYDEHMAGGKQLKWYGKGTGQGLDKGTLIKKVNPETGRYEVVGIKPATPKDVAARVTKLAGGYGRMRQAMQQGAARHDMPFSNGAQAAVWAKISKNLNPNHPDFPHHKMSPNGHLWNEMWNQRASGLHVPQQGEGPGGLHIPAYRLAAHGSMTDPDGPDDHDPLEGWGGPEDISHMLRHISEVPLGWDIWEDRPSLISLGPDSPPPPPQTPQEDRSDQRMGPGHLAAALEWQHHPTHSIGYHPDTKTEYHVAPDGDQGAHDVFRNESNGDQWYVGPAGTHAEGIELAEGDDPYQKMAAAGRGPHGQRPMPQSWRPPNKSRNDRGTTTVPDIWQGDTPDEDDPSDFELSAARYAMLYWADANWHDGPYVSAADAGDGHLLQVRYPWGEDNGNGSHSGNPHYEWHHSIPEGKVGGGIAPSLQEAQQAAEGSHADFGSDVDEHQDPLDPRLIGAARFARLYWASEDGLDEGLSPDEDKGKQPAVGGSTSVTNPNLNQSGGGALPTPTPAGSNGGGVAGGMAGGGGMPSGGVGSGAATPGGAASIPHPDGGPPSANLTQALQRAGIDPSMYSAISGFSATEGNNPSGAPTLGFTDSQAGGTLDQHALALSKQIKDRASVTGDFPHQGTPEQQASWMATLVGQNGSQSDWQGHAQPARSDYVNRIVKSMPPPVAAGPAPAPGV